MYDTIYLSCILFEIRWRCLKSFPSVPSARGPFFEDILIKLRLLKGFKKQKNNLKKKKNRFKTKLVLKKYFFCFEEKFIKFL